MSSSVTVYLSLGSNLGERERHLEKGTRLLARAVEVTRVSSMYVTEPLGYLQQPPFLNLACEAKTGLTPKELLAIATEVEREVGRKPTFRYGPRVLDIDILLYGDRVVSSPELTIPHPRMAERAFVLVPLAEIAPGQVHPVLLRTVAELLESVEGTDGVLPWGPPPDIASVRQTPAL